MSLSQEQFSRLVAFYVSHLANLKKPSNQELIYPGISAMLLEDHSSFNTLIEYLEKYSGFNLPGILRDNQGTDDGYE